MNFYGQDPARNEHEKAWNRAAATAWDAQWDALSPPARLAYLTHVRGAAKATSMTQPSTSAALVPAAELAELVASGLVRIDDGGGKKSPRVAPVGESYDFSTRVRTAYRSRLLGPPNRDSLAKYVRYAFYNQGEILIARVLDFAEVHDAPRLDEALANYVTSASWPGWATLESRSKPAVALVEALARAPGPVPLAEVPRLVPGVRPAEVAAALDALIGRLAVFEDLDPKTHGLIVGLLPEVRQRGERLVTPRGRPPLVVVERPEEFGPHGGTAVNDLRIFLLEVAGEPPRLRQDGGIFAKELPRFEAALPEWPDWLLGALKLDEHERVEEAYRHALAFQLVQAEEDARSATLRLTTKGRAWLAAGLEDQYRSLYESLRAYGKAAVIFDDRHGWGGDSVFLGIGLTAAPLVKSGGGYYYNRYVELAPKDREAHREAIRRALDRLPVGVFHTWESVLDHLIRGGENPLTAGHDPARTVFSLSGRPIPRTQEALEAAGRHYLDAFLKVRLLPFDAVRAAIDAEGRLCVARLARFDGFFGRDYQPEEAAPGGTRVIVQPDFTVMVIGLDPAPAAELAPFCERSRGHLGEGAITYRITRESVIRAASQGISGPAIADRLRKHASIGVPENVLREVREWAGSIRLVNVRPVTVVRCPDPETVDRVVAALGKKVERLGGNLAALHVPRITPADREKLQQQGIIITKEEITVTAPAPRAAAEAAPTPRKRGRPRKAL